MGDQTKLAGVDMGTERISQGARVLPRLMPAVPRGAAQLKGALCHSLTGCSQEPHRLSSSGAGGREGPGLDEQAEVT